jgi:hypothetical protein
MRAVLDSVPPQETSAGPGPSPPEPRPRPAADREVVQPFVARLRSQILWKIEEGKTAESRQ